MKLLLYGLNYAPEPVGIGKYSGELAEWLAGRGHEVRVITAPPYYPEWQAVANRYRKEQRQGVAIQRCPLWVPRRPSGVSRLLHLASFALSSLPVLLAQRTWHPEFIIVIAPAFFCAPGSLVLRRLCGKRTKSWLHIQDFELDAAFELGMLKGRWIQKMAQRWEQATLRSFDRVSTISEAMQNRVIAKGVRPPKTYLLPNWVDLNAIQPQGPKLKRENPYRSELGIMNDVVVLLYSGSMNQKQGLQIIIKTIIELADVPNLLWILAGEGPTKTELAEATKGICNVKLLPLQPVDRMNDWLNLADVHLLPQKANAADLVLPSKLLGMLASGRPVIASSPADSELGRMVEQAGVRVEPGDWGDFAKAARQLAGDISLRDQLGARGRKLAETFFERESILGNFEKEISDVTLKI
jgi:colanic acid biosynthesis glycosyl transferase WcaI